MPFPRMSLANATVCPALILENKTTNIIKLHQTIGFLRACDTDQASDTVTTMRQTNTGNSSRLSRGVHTSKNDIEIRRKAMYTRENSTQSNGRMTRTTPALRLR